MRFPRWAQLALAAALVAVALAGCSDDGGDTRSGSASGSASASGVGSTDLAFTADEADTHAKYDLKDYEFQGPETVKGPKVFFEAFNKAEQDHELVVKNATGKVMGEIEGIAPGKSGKMALELPAGDYELVCELKADDGKTHEQHGMKADLVVEDAQ
jgi:iron uptake system component EfeO